MLWTVTSGAGAALSDSLTLSDGNGRAEVSFTFGPNPGVYSVGASLRDSPDASVLLTATATDPPTLTAVQPTTFTGGDTLVLTGTGLSVPAAPEVGGAPARLLAATATSMSLLAPVCLVPGPVQIRVSMGTATTNTLTATFEADTLPLALEPGDYASIDPLQLAGCATFPVAGAAGAEYLLAPQAVTGSPGATAQYRLAGDSVVVSLAAPSTVAAQLPRAVRFHDALREQEREAAQRPRAPTSAFSLSSGALLARIELGDQRSFQVCGTLPCSGADDFETVTGDAMYVGNHAAVFLDRSAPAGFAQADFDSLGLIFDEELYDVDTRAFGAESDVDQNGVVIILFTPTVNKLTPKADCETSVITGYFFGVDIDPLFQNDPRS
ncbi:MAG: hypothetical protein JRF63_13295, partial [Deltaproteobacteria bacterium]|nr:hypothetical protein [Deltaproteobacteria bacterium]